MKRIIKIYSCLACFLLLTGNTWAQHNSSEVRNVRPKIPPRPPSPNAWGNGGVQKEKSFTTTYPLRTRQQVEIINKYGDVKINSWNRKEVKVDAVISVYAGNERTANDILDRINIESNDGEPVSFKTIISGNISNGKSQTVMEINYQVYMPAENPLSVKNHFGSTQIPDWLGDINVEQSYGNIVTGIVPNAQDFKVRFGRLSAKAIHNGNINISYSDLAIDQLKGSINARIDFCGNAKIALLKDLEKLDMKSSYSDVTLQVPESLSALLNINTSYGDLKNKSTVSMINETKEKKYGPTFNKIFSGKTGSGKSKINISSSFGEVILQ